ncbi:MAG: HAMP domain-containing protein [Holophagales bacterium]|nr:MAG: HAMP domain-containing protein [Holophagales bacterium]
MRRSTLAWLLALTGAFFVAVAVTGVAGVSERLLERLGRQQALARVELAGTAAREALVHEGETLAVSARLLAASPELGSRLGASDLAGVARLLESFQEAGETTGAALAIDARLVRQSTPPLPWPVLRRALPAGQGWAFAVDGTKLFLVAEAPVPSGTRATALMAREVDVALLAAIGRRIGLPVALVGRREALAGYGESHAARLARVVADGQPESLRSEEAGCFCALQPLPLASGEVAAVLETRLAIDEVDRSVAELRRRLLLLAGALAVVAALASGLLARRLAAPLAELSTAARRIGGGDLATPVAIAGPGEIGLLARAMEGMRRQLAQLSGRLASREGEARAVLEGISEGVFTVDRDRRVRYLNPPAARTLGLDSDAASTAIGRFCGDLLYPELAPESRPCEERCPILHARFRGAAQATETLALAAGSRRAVVAAATPVGELQVVVLREESEVEAGRRLRDALLANVSHEFKTPLAAQLASLEMLRDALATGDSTAADTLVEALGRGTARLTRLVDNLLESVSIEAGRDAIRRRPVDLEEVVEEAVQQVTPLLHQRNQELDLALPAPLPPVDGDAARLVQVLVNLLANANKFAPEGTPIVLGGEVGGDSVALFVEDRGPGLRGADPGSLFQPFVRAVGDESETSGVGLGLWVVRSIVERHGGTVEARDTGAGSRFTVRLRRGDAPPTR